MVAKALFFFRKIEIDLSSLFIVANMEVHDTLKLHVTSERFLFEPNSTNDKSLLVIDRVTKDIFLEPNRGQVPASAITKVVYGIVGIIKLVAGSYLIVITERQKVGTLLGHNIWKVTKTEVLPYPRTLNHLTEKQVNINKLYLNLLDIMLKTESFYYSTTFDLTHSQQRLHNTSPEFQTLTLFERADQRFVWNSHVLLELTQQPELASFCLPLILGFINIKACTVNGHNVDYCIISRRCIYRAGTRFNMRGVDVQGQVANFVETEQMVQYNGNVCSFVQTRGSIPLFWSQKADLKRLPKPIVTDSNHQPAFEKHFDLQVYTYGRQIIVNLINQVGSEQPLERKLAEVCAASKNSNVRYEAFDFHKECSKMRYDRLSILLGRLEQDRVNFGYFMRTSNQDVSQTQTGVFRTNCMDCLDRTNVVQSLLAREILQDQFRVLGVLNVEQKVNEQVIFEDMFRNVWADNADTISKEYAGTGALKTDFTRTGKRTVWGAMNDGYNSAVRYIKNNFQDGSRQDAIDLFLGNYIVEEGEGLTTNSPVESNRDWKYYAVPVIFVVAFSMFVVSILLPDEHVTEQLLYVMFWGVASGLSLASIYMFGTAFVDQPQLAEIKFKTE